MMKKYITMNYKIKYAAVLNCIPITISVVRYGLNNR